MGRQQSGLLQTIWWPTDLRSAGWTRCPQGDLRPHWTRKTGLLIISGAITPKSLPISQFPPCSPSSPASVAFSQRATLCPSPSIWPTFTLTSAYVVVGLQIKWKDVFGCDSSADVINKVTWPVHWPVKIPHCSCILQEKILPDLQVMYFTISNRNTC